MKITLLQNDIVWANPSQNIRKVDAFINQHPDSDLYVLPEMWSTGFVVQPQGIAEAGNDPALPPNQTVVNAHPASESLRWMIEKAQEKHCAIAGSVAICQDGRFYNRFYFVLPNGKYTYYNKRHLFSYGGEDAMYTLGGERIIVEYQHFRFLLLVCYDLRFPVWARNHKEYDCILLAANWPSSRQSVWEVLTKARAIENQCFVAAVNRIGKDPYCHYSGGTQLIDAYGKVIAQCPSDTEQAISAEIDKEALERFRKKFPVLDDAD